MCTYFHMLTHMFIEFNMSTFVMYIFSFCYESLQVGTFQKLYELYYVELNLDLWLYYDISKVNLKKHSFMWPSSSCTFEYSRGGF